jgi:hypothetical protein
MIAYLMVLGRKRICIAFENNGVTDFPNVLNIGVCFQNILNQYPLLQEQQRQGYCFNILEKQTPIFNMFAKKPIVVFKIATNPAFQRTII